MKTGHTKVTLAEGFKQDFLIGAAVNAQTIVTQQDLLKTHYNSLTAENEMKFESVHPAENLYTFEKADRIAEFARENGMKLRGHTLVWHNQTPDWVFEDANGGEADRETVLARMKTHIETVVNRYRHDIYCWDVVNEVISDQDGEWLRPSKWLHSIGEDFIAQAFRFAHEFAPEALLFYNDYNECNPVKREKIYRLVKSLLDQGVPIHGIGLQAHWNIFDPSLDEIRSAIERYASLGLKLQITEMDVSVFAFDDRRTDLTAPTAEMIRLQEERYEQFFRLFREYRDVLTGVTFWGAADDYTWLDDFPVRGRKNWPMLFNTEQQSKGALQKVLGQASGCVTKPRTPLVSHIFTADPSAHVFDGKLYIYPSHDLEHDGPTNDNGDQYVMEDYHILSMGDLSSPVIDHGVALHVNDVPWASEQMWAPDAAYKNNMYYLFFPARDHDGIFRIGAATSETPEGPFLPQENYIEGSYSIDPAVLVDDDNQAYMYFGGLWGGQLEKWQTGSFKPDAEGPTPSEPALGPRAARMSEDMLSFLNDPQEISILDEEGNPILASDENRRYFEGPWMHKYNGKYYLSYSTGTTHQIVYAIGDHPLGPFTFQGTILTPVIGWTTHHSIVEFQGKWYLFYHDCSLSDGVDHKRCVKYTELIYNEDGTIQKIDPYEE